MSDQEPTVYNGRYELHRQIARGGMADVFLARDRLLDRPVAVKVLFSQFATDPAFVERFRREAQSAANLNHPHITSVFDWGEEGGTYFIVMEFVDGRSLADILRSEGMLHPDRAADIATDVAAALSFAHRNGVVHRDIKPGNILVTPSGQVKVTDFGIARAFGSSTDANLTQTGSVMGTATYFSPEQAQGRPVDPRSDLYSLGVVLYEMLASRPPFSGDSAVSTAYMHVQERAEPPSSVNPRIPPAMDAICMRLLAKDPNDRYPSAEDLRADLRRFREGQQVLAGGGVPAAAAAAPAAAAAAPGATTSMPVTTVPPGHDTYDDLDDDYDEPPNRTGWFIAGLVVLIAVLVGLLAVFANALGIGGGETGTRIEVPGVVSLDETEATDRLEDAGFEVDVEYEANVEHEPGIVFDQDPTGGSMESEGSTVTIVVSQGDEEFAMPDVVGNFEDDAIEVLEDRGLVLGDVNRVFDDESTEGEVLTQFPAAEQMVTRGDSFDLTVSRGPEEIEVPDVRGDTVDDAVSALEDAGFQTRTEEEYSETVDEDRVVRTDPAHGTDAQSNSFVIIYVSRGPEPPEERPVPNVVNLTQPTAEGRLSDAGFVPEVTFSASDSVPSGSVITQDPGPGTELLTGSPVEIVVSTGPSPTTTTSSPTTTTTDDEAADEVP
ncbi:MAG: Stk1 family PASTA domain-containing Ser/Thr kinase [Acidimicrobiales bacterium]